MKVRSYLFEGMRSAVDNSRGHSVITDLPEGKHGQDSGATALEMTLMSLSACITTIYSLVAHNKKVPITKLLCEVSAEQDKQTGLKDVNAVLKVVSNADQQDLEKVFQNTLDTCPVGKLFTSAGLDLNEKLEIVDDF